MSQRLYIGNIKNTKPQYWDCIIENPNITENQLRDEWLFFRGTYFAGPWKIVIDDLLLFKEVSDSLKRLFNNLNIEKIKYPDCIWSFSYGDNRIDHPTEKELEEWIVNNEKSLL